MIELAVADAAHLSVLEADDPQDWRSGRRWSTKVASLSLPLEQLEYFYPTPAIEMVSHPHVVGRFMSLSANLRYTIQSLTVVAGSVDSESFCRIRRIRQRHTHAFNRVLFYRLYQLHHSMVRFKLLEMQ